MADGEEDMSETESGVAQDEISLGSASSQIGMAFDWDDLPVDAQRQMENKIADRAADRAPVERLTRQVVAERLEDQDIAEAITDTVRKSIDDEAIQAAVEQTVISQINQQDVDPTQFEASDDNTKTTSAATQDKREEQMPPTTQHDEIRLFRRFSFFVLLAIVGLLVSVASFGASGTLSPVVSIIAGIFLILGGIGFGYVWMQLRQVEL